MSWGRPELGLSQGLGWSQGWGQCNEIELWQTKGQDRAMGATSIPLLASESRAIVERTGCAVWWTTPSLELAVSRDSFNDALICDTA